MSQVGSNRNVGINFAVLQHLGRPDPPVRCVGGKLVDSKKREVRFYRLQGCWGNPPQEAREILQRQDEELKELASRFTLIKITCNPSGEMPY